MLPKLGLVLSACFVQLFLCSSNSVAVEEQRDLSSLGFIKGFTWGWDGTNGDFTSLEAKKSMTKMADMGCNWVCISFATSMPTYDNPQFSWSTDNPYMVSDEDIRAAIALARDLKLKVILKPVVNCHDRVWRAWIRFFRTVTNEEKQNGIKGDYDPWGDTPGIREGMVRDEIAWSQWWTNYIGFLKHYARIADSEQVEVFCVGCEMNSTEDQVESWENTIEEVRGIYDGFLTYNANHGRESQVSWWDDVDIISISAYYAVEPSAGESLAEAVKQTTSKAEIVATLNGIKQDLAQLSSRVQRPILFIETGVTSVRGAARYPWSFAQAHPESPVDQQEQANYYEAMLEVFWEESWFFGFTWWDWPAKLYFETDAAEDRDFCVYGKQAEKTLLKWYAKPTPARTSP